MIPNPWPLNLRDTSNHPGQWAMCVALGHYPSLKTDHAPLKTVNQNGKDVALAMSYYIMSKWTNNRENANYKRVPSGVWSWFQINERHTAWHLTMGIGIWILFLFGRDKITCLPQFITANMTTTPKNAMCKYIYTYIKPMKLYTDTHPAGMFGHSWLQQITLSMHP